MFITVHDYNNGFPFRINVLHLMLYDDYVIYTVSNGRYEVRETMQEIDSQLSMLHVQIALG